MTNVIFDSHLHNIHLESNLIFRPVYFGEDFSTKPSTSQSVIWNNKIIKIDGNSMYYQNYVKTGIIFCN